MASRRFQVVASFGDGSTIEYHIMEKENDLLRIVGAELSAEEQQRLSQRMQAVGVRLEE